MLAQVRVEHAHCLSEIPFRTVTQDSVDPLKLLIHVDRSLLAVWLRGFALLG